MADRSSVQRNDLSGQFGSNGGTQLNGVVFETRGAPVNIGHAGSEDQATLYKQCIRDLRPTDPRIDKRRIEGSKDKLLQGSCSWVVNDTAFQSWWAHNDPHLLWIHGGPGKGKTMIMLSLYSELSSRIEATGSGAVVSYFFCQSTDPRLNHAVAVLRGLIFLLVAQDKKTLLPHWREKLDEIEDLEGGSNLLYALFKMLIDLSIESRFSKVYLMIDALDECNSELSPLLGEINRSESLSYKIKWLVTSRNESLIRESLSSHECPGLSLELNSTHVSQAINAFIGAKVAKLAQMKQYDSDLKAQVEKYLSDKAGGIFLWVASVCKELEAVRKLDTMDNLGKFPAPPKSPERNSQER
ncbi:heterokaryon incompatibility protein [Hyaloscypha sp. PMI_1271]|nr:heterokaryon incompatibility protein [Hyaloscypha sp. PMI_1271]